MATYIDNDEAPPLFLYTTKKEKKPEMDGKLF